MHRQYARSQITLHKSMIMKKYVIIFLALTITNTAIAGSINAAAYRTMQVQSYRNNYNRQVNNSTIPYWQMQSNYTTRNRVDYSTYQNYVNQYNSNTRMQRSRY